MEGHLEGEEEAEEEAFHLAEEGVVGEGETLAKRKERAPLGLPARVPLGGKHRQPSEKIKTGKEKINGRCKFMGRFLET